MSTDNAMAKRKKKNIDPQNTSQKSNNRRSNNTNPIRALEV